MNIRQLASSILGNNPQAMAEQMYNNNPQFRQFVDANKGKSLDDIGKAYGIRP